MNGFQRFIQQRILGIKEAKPGKVIPFTPTAAYGLPEPAPMDQAAQLASYNSWVYACAKKISSEFANINLLLYKRKKAGDVEEEKTHDVLDLLDRVNNYMTRYDLFEYTGLIWEMSGECFWWKIKDEQGNVVSIYPYLSPPNMAVVPDKNTFVKGYIYTVPGTNQTIPFGPDEIIHFKYPNPLNPYRGLSAVKAAEYAISTDKQAAKWNFNFFKNSAKPYGVVIYPGTMTDDQYKRLQLQWEVGHGGVENSNRIAILEGGNNDKIAADFKEIGFGQKDMDFVEQRKFGRDEIFVAFGIPKGIMIAEDVNRAVAETHESVFVKNTIIPKYKKFVSYLNEFLLPDFDEKDELFFDFADPTIRDIESQLKVYESGIKNGWLSPNEIREQEGYAAYEGGEGIYMPVNMIPIGKAPKKKKSIKFNMIRRRRTTQEKIDDVIKSVTDKAKDSLTKLSKSVFGKKKKTKKIKKTKKKKNFFNKAQREKYAINHIKRADREEALLRIKVRNYFTAQEKRVLPTLKGGISIRFDVKSETTLAIAAFRPIIESLVKEHGDDTMALLGLVGFDMDVNEVATFLEKDGLKFANEINKVTKKKLSKSIAAGTEAGEDIATIRNRIKGIFRAARITRAKSIARTEVSRASNFSTVEAYKQSKVVRAKEWLTTPDERLCDYCAPMDGKIVSIDKNFFDEGDSYTGNAERPINMDYGKVEQPPLHAQCRCTTVPVLK